MVVQNTSIRFPAKNPGNFSPPPRKRSPPKWRRVSPDTDGLYALLYAIGGQQAPQPWIFHLANVLWHGLAAMLLFSVALLLCQRLTGAVSTAERMASLLIALGFAAHPVQHGGGLLGKVHG